MKQTVIRRLLLGVALPLSLLLFGLLLGRPQPAYSALHNFAVTEDADVLPATTRHEFW